MSIIELNAFLNSQKKGNRQSNFNSDARES